MKFNLKGILIGGSITALVLWVYTTIIATYVSDIASQISSFAMGINFVMGFFVYVVVTYLDQMFNK